jgi:tetratricopeptide (TPR) repeat protein
VLGRRVLVSLSACLIATTALADRIVLNNGRVIDADRAWFEGGQVRYQKDGGVYGLPRTLVKRLDPRPPPSADPEVARARERLSAGDAAEAVRLAQSVLVREPRSLAALHVLAEAYLALGDAQTAQQTARAALVIDERQPHSHALLGDALAALGDRLGAEQQYKKSLLLRSDSEVKRKLEDVASPPARPTGGAQFRLRYDGGVNEPLGRIVLAALSDAYAEFSRRLGFRPEEPVDVVLQLEANFPDERVPRWAEGINDGTIRVPVLGLTEPNPRLITVLRHELAHSFIAARTGGNCPTWLQEGVSQWLEGGDPGREDPQLAQLARAGRLHPLVTLEGPFRGLSAQEAAQAYAESLSAVAYIVRRRGEAGLVRLLNALGDRIPSEEALPVALAITYVELQQGWEDHLRGLRP